ncbi:hypothetical protein [Weissella viridescens]|uniref:hypothetical protein n=1 Tax=Weissella viridescens TaxID=1629 RepID=UPI003AF29E9C
MTEKTEATIPLIKQGVYGILNTTLTSDDTMWFDEMSGDLGDAGRTVYLAIKARAANNDPKTPLVPMNMTGRDVRLVGHDAHGVFKSVGLATKIVNATAGLVEMTLPRALYQAVGAYQNAEFEIYEKQGNTKVSSVRVGFEVYNNHAHMTTGESEMYIDEFEELKKRLEKATADEIDYLNKQFEELTAQITTATNSVEALKQLIATWTKNVNDKAVALLNAKNTFTEVAEFLKPIIGYTTGTTIKFFDNTSPQQDLNDITVLRNLPKGTTSRSYYYGNQLKNNPITLDYVLVETHKLTDFKAFQTLHNIGGTEGYELRRVIDLISTNPVYGQWKIVSRWTPWRSMVPYLDKQFAVGNVEPMYRIDGNSVHIKGDLVPTKTIPNTDITKAYTMFDNLPFNFVNAQVRIQVGSGLTTFALFTSGKRMEMQKYSSNGQLVSINAGGYIGMSGVFSIES